MNVFYKIILSVLVVGMFSLASNAQDKKFKARLSVDYIYVMGETPYLEVATKFKGEDGYEPCQELTLNVYNQINEDSIQLEGAITTNSKGIARFNIENIRSSDTIIAHSYIIKIEDSKKFKKAEKEINFLESTIKADVVEIDSVNTIKAILTDGLGEPIEGAKLKINIQRLFAPMAIGRSYKTNGAGEIFVPLEESFSGVDGQLVFEVFVDSKKYGTVTYLLKTSIGDQIRDLSTFNQRTMWSPPSKTPWFLLIFPNLLLAGIWIVILVLVRNMYKIYKN